MKPTSWIILCLVLFFNPGCRTYPHAEINMDNHTKEFRRIENEEKLSAFDGIGVSLDGTLSNIPWQHMIHIPETYSYISYLDSEAHGQIVIYSKTRITCRRKVTIYGTVFKVEGKSKRPGSEDRFTEYQIIAEKWKCL